METPHTTEPSNGLSALVFVALLVLLGATVGAGQVELGPWSFFTAVAIATIKAVLILLFFMRVRYGTPLVWLVAGSGFFWLVILFGLTMSDYFTRKPQSGSIQSAFSHLRGVSGVQNQT